MYNPKVNWEDSVRRHAAGQYRDVLAHAIREQTQLRAFVVRSLQTLGLGVEALKPAAGRPGKGFGWKPEED